MSIKSHVLVILFTISSMLLSGQNAKAILQKTSATQNLYISPDDKHFMTYIGDIQSNGGITVMLWDYQSKIMIAERWFDSENGPGSGKINLLNHGKFIISTNHSLLKVDLLNNKTDTIFTTVYPEYIHAKAVVNDSLLLVSTKIYPDTENGLIYDITNNSKLYLYNLNTKTIVHQNAYEFEIPYIKYSVKNNQFLISNNKGDVLLLDNNLETQKKINFFRKKPARFLHLTADGYLFANSALSMDKNEYEMDIGEGVIVIKHLEKPKFEKEISFQEQEPTEQNDPYALKLLPSNLVDDIQVDSADESIFINYGHSKLVKVDSKNFTLTDISPKDFKGAIGKIILNQKSKELFVSYGEQKLIASYDNLAIYNYNSRKFTYEFSEIQGPLLNFKTLIKVSDQYVFGYSKKENNPYNLDSLRLLNPETRKTTVVNCESCLMTVNPGSDTWLFYRKSYYNEKIIIVAEPTKTLLKNPQITIEIDNLKELTTGDLRFKDKKVFQLTELEKGFSIQGVYHYFPNSEYFLVNMRHKEKVFYAIIDNTGKTIKQFKSEYDLKWDVSNSGEFFAISDGVSGKRQNIISVFNTNSWELLWTHTIKQLYFSAVRFNTEGTKLYFKETSQSETDDEILQLKEVPIKLGVQAMKTVHSGAYYHDFMVEGQMLYLYTTDYLKQIDLITNTVVWQSRASSTSSKPALFPDSKKIVMDGGDYLAFFDTSSDQVVQYYFFDNDNQMAINQSGYYMSSSGLSSNQFGFLIGENGYPFTQFDMIFNRPDIVLGQMDVLPKDVLSLYKRAYEKRLANSPVKVDVEALNKNEIPQISLLSKNLSFTSKTSDYEIKAYFIDEKHALNSWNIWVNGVPVFGQQGQIIEGELHDFQAEQVIALSQGNNTIQISCTNNKGLQSLKLTQSVFYDGQSTKPKTYFIGIGVSKYQDSTYNLSYAKKDALDLEQLFKTASESVETFLYLDENATKANILKLKETLQKTSVDDTVILSFSGHGLLAENQDFYCATYDIDFKNPEHNGLNYTDLEWLLDGIPSRKKLVFIDACHSGALDQDDEELVVENPTIEGETVQLTKTSAAYNTKGAIGTSTAAVSLENSYTLMQSLFADLSRGNGAVVISAAGGKEYALENNDWKNGAFTFAVREGIENKKADLDKNGRITVSELKKYVSKTVEKLTNGLQKPTSRQDNLENDFEILID